MVSTGDNYYVPLLSSHNFHKEIHANSIRKSKRKGKK